MLIPALIEAILALAAGSVAGVAKAIEFGLRRLIPPVISLGDFSKETARFSGFKKQLTL